MTAAWLGIAMVPLGACKGDVSAVHAEKDAKGRTEIKVDHEEVDQNLKQAQKDLDTAGQQLQKGVKQGAQEVGGALQRGAQKVQAEVGPVAREVLNDAGITARVKAKLIADPEVAAVRIDVDTVNGRVTLNGKVSTEDQKAEAEKLARHTDGVVDVVNLIQVGPASPPPPAPKPR